MKAEINTKEKIHNFQPNNYKLPNGHPYTLKEIKGFNKDIDMEQVKLNATRESGVFKYYLDAEGIVQQKDITKEPEYKVYQVEKLVAKKTRDMALDAVAEENPDLASVAIGMKA